MATALLRPGESRLDRYFFPGMAILILGAVFVGFAKTYFLAGVFRAPLPNWLIHVHGAAFSAWVLLLITQTSLVAADRVAIHRKLGVAGFWLASAMVVLGTLAATDALRRAVSGRALDAKIFYIVPLTDVLLFGAMIFFAYRARFRPAAHKRLILIATIALMDAAVARWPFAFIRHHPLWVIDLYTEAFLLLLVAYDLWTTGRLHRVTIWGSAVLIVVQQARLPIGETATWQAFATWAQHLAQTVGG